MAANFPLFLIPLFPLLGALFCLTLGRRASRQTVHVVACGVVFLSLVVTVHAIVGPLWDLYWPWHEAGGMAPDPVVRNLVYTWMAAGDFQAEVAFLLDPLSAVMIFTVTFVGFLIHLYSMGYMSHDPRYAAYFGYLNLFTGAMLILVLADNLVLMFVGWEGVGLCSFLLIGFWFDKEKNANAGRKAFVVNRIGDFAFLLGIFLVFVVTRTVEFDGIRAAMPLLERAVRPGWELTIASVVALLFFAGATGKSAQIPLYVWLPDAMAGPTPVSALIHAATMVTAGVYMVARLGFLYVEAPLAMMVVAAVGAVTALFAAIIGFAQTDIKKVLAYSTVSQLGFMFVGVGTGAFVAGIFHLFTHAFFKAGLFLGAGSVMHAMGDRTEIMEMGGLRKKIPITHATFLVYCLAIAGIFPFAGFFSKDEILLGAFTAHIEGWPAWFGHALFAVLLAAAVGTAFYMWRLYFLVFWGECRADEETRKHIHESPSVMTVPLVVLAVGAVVLGFLGLPHVFGLPNLLGDWLSPSVVAHEAQELGATPWVLMGTALMLSVVGIGAAAYFYKDGPTGRIRRLVAAILPIQKVVANKFYVDELYDVIIVRPFRFAAQLSFRFVDRIVIDFGLVEIWAWILAIFGRLARLWQNGDLQRYLVALLLGAAAIVWFTLGGGTP